MSKQMGNTQTGATMIEVLVAILVFAIGLLAIVSSQTLGLTNTQSALNRSYAAHLSYELVDTMRMNMREVRSAGSVFNNFATDPTPNNQTFAQEPDCLVVNSDNSCSTDTLAEHALAVWEEKLERLLPEGRAILVNAGGVYTLSIQWADFRNDEERVGAAAIVGVDAGRADLIAAQEVRFEL